MARARWWRPMGSPGTTSPKWPALCRRRTSPPLACVSVPSPPASGSGAFFGRLHGSARIRKVEKPLQRPAPAQAGEPVRRPLSRPDARRLFYRSGAARSEGRRDWRLPDRGTRTRGASLRKRRGRRVAASDRPAREQRGGHGRAVGCASGRSPPPRPRLVGRVSRAPSGSRRHHLPLQAERSGQPGHLRARRVEAPDCPGSAADRRGRTCASAR